MLHPCLAYWKEQLRGKKVPSSDYLQNLGNWVFYFMLVPDPVTKSCVLIKEALAGRQTIFQPFQPPTQAAKPKQKHQTQNSQPFWSVIYVPFSTQKICSGINFPQNIYNIATNVYLPVCISVSFYILKETVILTLFTIIFPISHLVPSI